MIWSQYFVNVTYKDLNEQSESRITFEEISYFFENKLFCNLYHLSPIDLVSLVLETLSNLRRKKWVWK